MQRDEHYLLKTLSEEQIEEMGVTPEELASYEKGVATSVEAT